MADLDTFDDLLLNRLREIGTIKTKSEFVRAAVKKELLYWDQRGYINLVRLRKSIENKVG